MLPYRRQAPAAGQHPGDGQGQDRGQVMAHAPTVPGISHVPENLDQGLARQGGRGGGCIGGVTSLVTGLSRRLHRHRAGHAAPTSTRQTH